MDRNAPLSEKPFHVPRHFPVHRRNQTRAAIDEGHLRTQGAADRHKLDAHRATACDHDVSWDPATLQDRVRVADAWDAE